jgi:phosphocarrier protein
MYSRIVTIINNTGLHARPATIFIQCAKGFQSNISIQRMDSDEAANAKSIINVLSQCFTKGTGVRISAQGDDEREAVDTLVAMIEGGFEDH